MSASMSANTSGGVRYSYRFTYWHRLLRAAEAWILIAIIRLSARPTASPIKSFYLDGRTGCSSREEGKTNEVAW